MIFTLGLILLRISFEPLPLSLHRMLIRTQGFRGDFGVALPYMVPVIIICLSCRKAAVSGETNGSMEA